MPRPQVQDLRYAHLKAESQEALTESRTQLVTVFLSAKTNHEELEPLGDICE